MKYIPISKCRNDDEIVRLLSDQGISLSPDEALRVVKVLGRDPSPVEGHIFNTMWSEHCSYKSSKALLTRLLPTKASNVIQGPEEDAGIVALGENDGNKYGLVVAHESHNHPSQVVPIEGAATGIGGILRDVYCMGAEVIGVMDGLRFGDPGGKHGPRVREISESVVTGIWQYGNPVGVPNLGGDLYFDASFDENCLVNVVAFGVVDVDRILHSRVPESAKHEQYVLILVGKPTDESGFGGATFASDILDGDAEEENRGAVQIPDPFLKRVLFYANKDVMDILHDEKIDAGFKDLGAGGIACATSEMGAVSGFGVELDLDAVPTADDSIRPEVVSCSETQERFCWVVPERIAGRVLEIYNVKYELPHVSKGAKAAVIGRVTNDESFRILENQALVCNASISAITTGINYDRKITPPRNREMQIEFPMDEPLRIAQTISELISSPHLSSRLPVFRRYDTEVQGKTIIRPGEADAGVIQPFPGNPLGIAVSLDGNPRYCRLDPYMGAVAAVAEGMRNVAAAGAVPACITDCLNYGNPEEPEVMYQFEAGLRGISDACRYLHRKGNPEDPVPVVSGNVSFYNQSSSGRSVAPSPIIATYGLMDDYSNAITMSFKQSGNPVYLLGSRRNELGGSVFLLERFGIQDKGMVPAILFDEERKRIHSVIDLVSDKIVSSVHDISDGGMITCALEMCLQGSGLSIEIDIREELINVRPDVFLFSESSGFLLEVHAGLEDRFLDEMKRVELEALKIGSVTESGDVSVRVSDLVLPPLNLSELRENWLTGLDGLVF